MKANPFITNSPALKSQILRSLQRLPPLTGAPIRLSRAAGLRDRHGDSHAVTFLRKRRILFDCIRAEFPRIFVHEVFHFVWLRAGNATRNSFEKILAAEIANGARGELGWSAEWRKLELTTADRRDRTRRWREYCCESFCDTAAWLYSGLERHDEFTLAKNCRKLRRQWFADTLGVSQIPI